MRLFIRGGGKYTVRTEMFRRLGVGSPLPTYAIVQIEMYYAEFRNNTLPIFNNNIRCVNRKKISYNISRMANSLQIN